MLSIIKKLTVHFSLLLIISFLSGCSDNDKKIIGTWQRTVIEGDGGRYEETYVFFDGKQEKRVEYSYVPKDYDHMGYKASGTWDTDLMGNLKLYLDPGTATAAYNGYADEWQQAQISLYIAGIKLALSRQLKEMEDAYYGLEITEDNLIIETASGKDRFDRVRFLSPSNNSSTNYSTNVYDSYYYDDSDDDYEGEDYAGEDGPQDTPGFYDNALAIVPDLYLGLMPGGIVRVYPEDADRDGEYIKDNGAYFFQWGSGTYGDNQISLIYKNTMYTIIPTDYSNSEFWSFYWDNDSDLKKVATFDPQRETVFLKTTEGVKSMKLSSIPKENQHNVIWN